MTEPQPEAHPLLSAQDERDLSQLLTADGKPEFHTVLEVWREVLKPAASLAHEKVTPQYASKMVSTYPGLHYVDIKSLLSDYYYKIDVLLKILIAEIATDDDCLIYRAAEDDVEFNSGHYKNLLRDWQLQFLQWELDWDTTDPAAAIELAAISEVHKMFFGATGVTQFLDNIKFEFNETDQAELATALTELRDERVARSE